MSALSLHPARLGACFRAPLPKGAAQAFLTSPRYAERAQELAARHYGLADLPQDGLLRQMLALPPEGRAEIVERAGIILNAKEFLREISGPAIAALEARFGARAFGLARACHDLSRAYQGFGGPEALAQAVARDGQLCLAGWVAQLPPEAVRAFALAWPDDDALPRLPEGAQAPESARAVLERALAMGDCAA